MHQRIYKGSVFCFFVLDGWMDGGGKHSMGFVKSWPPWPFEGTNKKNQEEVETTRKGDDIIQPTPELASRNARKL